MRKTLRMIALPLSLAALAGCGAGGEEPNTGAAMSAIGGAITAPGNSNSSATTPAPLSAIEVEDTKSLVVADDFAFDTAQTINIDFDLESARGSEASVSICTRYNQDASGYDINYDSCTVRGDMSDGIFTHAMDVTNEYESVVAVVWFQDAAMQPVYREFSIGNSGSDRTTRSADGKKVIVWR